MAMKLTKFRKSASGIHIQIHMDTSKTVEIDPNDPENNEVMPDPEYVLEHTWPPRVQGTPMADMPALDYQGMVKREAKLLAQAKLSDMAPSSAPVSLEGEGETI